MKQRWNLYASKFTKISWHGIVVFSLARKDTTFFALMQINGEKVAIFWCRVYGVKCKGGNYSACTPRAGQVTGT